MRRFIPLAVPVLILAGAAPLALANSHQTAHVAAKSSHAGQIQFGEGLKHGRVVHPNTKIAKNKPVAWIAHFLKKPGTSKVTVKIIQTTGPGMHPQRRWTATISTSKSALTAKYSLSPKQLNKKHFTPNAHFKVEYLVHGKPLSVGHFQRLNCANCSGGGGTGGY